MERGAGTHEYPELPAEQKAHLAVAKKYSWTKNKLGCRAAGGVRSPCFVQERFSARREKLHAGRVRSGSGAAHVVC